jgi:Fe-S oxidoreductase
MVGAFSFIGLVATDKIGHIIISSLNVYYGNLKNESTETKYLVPVISPTEFETAESFGVSKVEEYTWKQLMDGDACTRCGRCQDNCPAWLTEKPLSPKKIINDVKDNMDERIPKLMLAEDPSTVETTPLIGGSVQPDEFWSCTNCAACMENCPVNIEHIPKMIDMRRYKILMEGDMAPELQTTFQNLEGNFNPYGFAFAERGAWLPADLGVKTLAEDTEVDYVYFVGSAASYDKRNQKIAISLLKILKKAGIKVGIIGSEEADSGDAAMRGGNEYLFHALATQNLETFKAYGVKKIICTCPHDYNTLKKEYKSFSKVGMGSDGKPLEANYEVFHHSQILADLIKKGQIKLVHSLNERITLHDSCFLGRYNDIYDEPRSILTSIPGVQFVEMSRNHSNSFCCGAGGARMFIEEHIGTRINQFRTKDALASGATRIATACPFCMTMLSDGISELDIQNMECYDIAEYVFNAMEK